MEETEKTEEAGKNRENITHRCEVCGHEGPGPRRDGIPVEVTARCRRCGLETRHEVMAPA